MIAVNNRALGILLLTSIATCQSMELKDAKKSSPQHKAPSNPYLSLSQDEKTHRLIQAIQKRNSPLVQQLLEAGANPNKSRGRWTMHEHPQKPMSLINSYFDEAVFRLLVTYGGQVNTINELKETLLHQACCWANVEPVVFLIQNNANINATDGNSNTPLHTTCSYCSNDITVYAHIVELLVTAGANVSIINDDEKTALQCAAADCQATIAKAIQRGLMARYWMQVAILLASYRANARSTIRTSILPIKNIENRTSGLIPDILAFTGMSTQEEYDRVNQEQVARTINSSGSRKDTQA